MNGLHKVGFRFFLDGLPEPELPRLIPVFHRWIQTQAVEGTLIDVADYSHVPGGPGILLVAHEGNYGADHAGGRPGLVYYRKRPLHGTFAERVEAVSRAALRACRALEEAPELEGRVRFRSDELLFFANDRLIAPNTPETFRSVRPALEDLFGRLWPARRFRLEPEADPKERFAVSVKVDSAQGVSRPLDALVA